MTKQAEQSYLEKTGPGGWDHSKRKPFSDRYCGLNLASIGTIMNLLQPPPARLLDLGCGGGWTSIFFAKYGYETVGQDISEDMLSLARENQAENAPGTSNSLSFILGDYENLDLAGQFDCAVFFDSLHHSDDEGAALRSAFKALKSGGTLITHEPGEGHSIAPGSVEAMKIYGVNERDMPPWLIMQRAKEIGFGNFNVVPMVHELNEIFYRDTARRPKLLSREGLRLAERLLKLAFRPSMRASSIVVMQKP
ncbi:MAG TPA: class I SAM-dependent methyltransferase [Usitatibacteraceae bacterium]